MIIPWFLLFFWPFLDESPSGFGLFNDNYSMVSTVFLSFLDESPSGIGLFTDNSMVFFDFC